MHISDEQDGRDTADLGTLLLTFLMRYGSVFDYDQHAVSVGQGGVILRKELANPIPAGAIVQLIVEDLDTKRCACCQSADMPSILYVLTSMPSVAIKVACLTH